MKTKSKMTLVRLMAGKNMAQIAREDGVSHQAIRFRLTPRHLATYTECRARRTADRRQAEADGIEERRARWWRNKPVARFWEKVDVRGPDECWEWHGCRFLPGYGHLGRWGDEWSVYAHRVAFEIANDGIPDGLFICHNCDNPPCCNPAHLWAGTAKDNIQDSIRKGKFFAWREEWLKSGFSTT